MSETQNGPRYFNKQAAIDQAKHEDSDGYFGFMSGAEWQHQQDTAVIADLEQKLQTAIDALNRAQFIIVEDECEECGTFKGVKYEIRGVVEALAILKPKSEK